MATDLIPEVRLGRNFIRRGDPCKVKLPTKSQFKTGFKFVGYRPDRGEATVRDPRTGALRTVTLDRIQRVAVTKHGERIQ